MNIQEKIDDFQSLYLKYWNNRKDYTLNSMLGLPFYDLKFITDKLIYPYIQISEKMAIVLMSIKSNMSNDRFNNVTNFERIMGYYYTHKNDNISITLSIENAFNQWADIAESNQIDVSDLKDKKDILLKHTQNLLKVFSVFDDFLEKYQVAEEFYINNKNDENVSDFYKNELMAVLEEYDVLFQQETIARMYDFKNLCNMPNDPMLMDEYAEIQNKLNIDYFDNPKHLEDFHVPVSYLLRQIDEQINDIRDRIKLKNALSIATMAEKFITEQSTSTSELTHFLKVKGFDENIDNFIKFTAMQKVQEVYSFKDGSIAFKDKDGYKTIIKHTDYQYFNEDLLESGIDFQFRKKPKIGSFFKNKFKEDQVSYADIKPVINTYLNNEDILKNIKFNITSFEDKSFEAIDDIMSAFILDYKIQRYARSILSNKYEHLLSDASMKTFKVLYESGLAERDLQNLVGKKIAAIPDSEAFEKYMVKVAGQLSGFNDEALFLKLQKHEIAPIHNAKDIVVFEVKNFEQSKDLGSASWCISRSANYFNEYTANQNRQFFIYDFSKHETDNYSMIGFTLRENGTFSAQHSKNDDSIQVSDFLKGIRNAIVLKDLDKFEPTIDIRKEIGLENDELFKKEVEKKKSIKIGI